jgi:hypothetical protein
LPTTSLFMLYLVYGTERESPTGRWPRKLSIDQQISNLCGRMLRFRGVMTAYDASAFGGLFD